EARLDEAAEERLLGDRGEGEVPEEGDDRDLRRRPRPARASEPQEKAAAVQGEEDERVEGDEAERAQRAHPPEALGRERAAAREVKRDRKADPDRDREEGRRDLAAEAPGRV